MKANGRHEYQANARSQSKLMLLLVEKQSVFLSYFFFFNLLYIQMFTELISLPTFLLP